jgi:hypothetical protein
MGSGWPGMKWDEPRGGRGADIAEIGKAKAHH